VSTAAVFFSVYRDRTRAIQETELPQLRGLESGYRQSKWVAEQLIRQAQARGIPASIYRPSLITGHSETGVTNALDLTSRFLQGCHQLGLWPQGNMEVNIAPVDYVAKAIVHLSSDEATLGGAYHVANPRITRLATIIECGVAMGYALPEVSYREWRAALIGQAEEGIQNALHPLLPLFPADLPEDAGYPIDCRLAQGRLEPLGIRCPEIGPELLANCARYLFSAGIIPRVAMTAAV
jgi:thioester reductase-like protein